MEDEKPMVVRPEEVTTEVYKDGMLSNFVSNDAWSIGLYFMEPGMETIVFSTEETDDGTAEEWYGSAYEFYLILAGEFTVWFGKDATELRRKSGPNLLLRSGDVASYPPGWKYLVKNTGSIPGSFFWGKTAPLPGVSMRENAMLKIIRRSEGH